MEVLEHEIAALSEQELAECRRWFDELEAERCDQSIETDVIDGKLDDRAAAALEDHSEGRSTRM